MSPNTILTIKTQTDGEQTIMAAIIVHQWESAGRRVQKKRYVSAKKSDASGSTPER